MIRKFIYISIFALLLQTSSTFAGTEGSEELKKTSSQDTAEECFEGVSRAMFKFNHALDKVIFETFIFASQSHDRAKLCSFFLCVFLCSPQSIRIFTLQNSAPGRLCPGSLEHVARSGSEEHCFSLGGVDL